MTIRFLFRIFFKSSLKISAFSGSTGRMDHSAPYPAGYIEDILSSVRSIAVVGASPKPWRPSNGVMETLIEAGYDVYPVNPGIAPGEILGRRCYRSLAEIGHPVDMVDVFREPAALKRIAEEAVAIGAGVLWFQIGVWDPEAARQAEAAGLRVVMNRCPKIELARMQARPAAPSPADAGR